MKGKKIQLVIATANLLPGGAERVLSFLATEIDKEQFEVTIVVFGHERDVSYDLKGVNTVFFGRDRVMHGIFDFLKFLKRHKPDIVLTAIGHLNTLAAYASWFFPKTKFVAREVNVLSVLDTFTDRKLNYLKLFTKNRFRFFDAIICQSDDMKEDLKKSYSFNYDKMVVINNPITDGFKVKEQLPPMKPVALITVGRLAKEKGYDRLLNVLSRLDLPFHYTMIGRGPEKENIFRLIDDYKLGDKITHIEYTAEIPDYLRKSHIYLQGAYVEGFPNAVIESASVGTPVLAFDAPGGINEIIEDGINGYRVFSAEDYLKTLKSICLDYTFVPELVSASVNKKYNKDIIIQRFEALFLKLCTVNDG
ncbi:MAG: glycosyltransferase [Flavobacteriaceae bacterium]|nr:glycosyltransferase [Flavobacteriaceae bacterium]NNK72281.1 glycosyltransferase [Flavobacteriaceae bacterium]